MRLCESLAMCESHVAFFGVFGLWTLDVNQRHVGLGVSSAIQQPSEFEQPVGLHGLLQVQVFGIPSSGSQLPMNLQVADVFVRSSGSSMPRFSPFEH